MRTGLFFVLDDRLKFLDLVSVLDAFMHIEMDDIPMGGPH